MGIIEVILLLVGAVLAVLSFVLPVTKDEVAKETKVLAKEEIKSMVDSEMDGIRQHVDDVVDEAIEYAVEKTERSLERLTNEKIMAVNEYSDTVLQEINKNHEEAMFLYDMLNTKHDNLKDAVMEADKAVQEAKATMEKMAPMQESLAAEPKIQLAEFERLEPDMIPGVFKQEGMKNTKSEAGGEGTKEVHQKSRSERLAEAIKEWDFLAASTHSEANNNDRILELHKQGKSTVAIAKELGLGVGEVKLVIDLYKNS